jgi:hypothetical protein
MHLTGQQTAESQLPSGYSKLGPWLYGLGWLVKKTLSTPGHIAVTQDDRSLTPRYPYNDV